MAVKGKEVAGKSSAGRRKAVSEPSAAAETSKSTVLKRKAVSKPYAAAAAAAAEKSGTRKKRMRSVANFFDDEAVDADSGQAESDNEDEDDQDFLDDIESEGKGKNESGMRYVPFLVKEEELSDEELENLLKQRYRHGSEHVVCADESKETTEYDDREALMASMKDPTLWRVKCAVGREQYLAFCLIQKYFDVQSLGTKLPMISVLALDHMKGYIYVEADRQFDVSEISPVLNSEVPHLLSVRDKVSEVSAGAWVRVKYGTYKGDLAQVVAVDKTKRHAMIKLVPRIDLQALSQKLLEVHYVIIFSLSKTQPGVGSVAAWKFRYCIGNGVPLKQAVAPAPRLISSCDLEMFGDHIQRKQDRLTGEFFETIDGLMLKNGYLHKKLAFGSLTCWEVQPLPEEKEKFKVVDDLSENSDWLSGIYRGRRKTHPGSAGKGMGETSEGISETDGDSFELHDLVMFGGTDFGVIVGMESHTFQILRGDPERADTVAVNIWEVKSRHIDKAISAPDIHKNIITVDDSVKVSEGPYKDAPPGFDNPIESPVIPQSPQRPDKWGENERPFNRDRRDGDCTFSIGQTLRIRVGPLKGHLCRVVAMYRSDVTVKLDSQPKVIKDVSDIAIINTKQKGSSTDINPFGTISSNNNNRTGGTADPWESSVFGSGNQMSSIKATSSWDKAAPSSGDQNASWNKSTEVEKAVVSKDQSGGWDAHAWGKSTATNDDGSGWTGGCQKKVSGGDQAGSLNDTGGWGKAKFGTEPKTKDGSSWTDSWEKKVSSSDQAGTSNDAGSWGKAKHEAECQTGTANIGGWEKAGAANEQGDCRKTSDNSWDKGKEIVQDCNSAWNSGKGNDANETNSWGKAFQCQTNVETDLAAAGRGQRGLVEISRDRGTIQLLGVATRVEVGTKCPSLDMENKQVAGTTPTVTVEVSLGSGATSRLQRKEMQVVGTNQVRLIVGTDLSLMTAIGSLTGMEMEERIKRGVGVNKKTLMEGRDLTGTAEKVGIMKAMEVEIKKMVGTNKVLLAVVGVLVGEEDVEEIEGGAEEIIQTERRLMVVIRDFLGVEIEMKEAMKLMAGINKRILMEGGDLIGMVEELILGVGMKMMVMGGTKEGLLMAAVDLVGDGEGEEEEEVEVIFLAGKNLSVGIKDLVGIEMVVEGIKLRIGINQNLSMGDQGLGGVEVQVKKMVGTLRRVLMEIEDLVGEEEGEEGIEVEVEENTLMEKNLMIEINHLAGTQIQRTVGKGKVVLVVPFLVGTTKIKMPVEVNTKMVVREHLMKIINLVGTKECGPGVKKRVEVEASHCHLVGKLLMGIIVLGGVKGGLLVKKRVKVEQSHLAGKHWMGVTGLAGTKGGPWESKLAEAKDSHLDGKLLMGIVVLAGVKGGPEVKKRVEMEQNGGNGSGRNKGWSTGKEVGGSGGHSSGLKASDGDHSAGWSKGWSGGKEEGGSGTKSSDWKTSDMGNGSGWNKGWSTGKEAGGGEGQSSGWGKDNRQGSGWNEGQTSSIKAAGEMGNEADGLNSKKGFDGTPSAGWNTGADTNKDTGVDGGGGWNRGNARDGAGSWDKHDGGSGSSKGGW
ncbi:hypothetical protein ACLOJK_020963 [Asimina triloba]